MQAGNSDLYFTKIDHDHTGFGNTASHASIEKPSNYDALMLLGRANAQRSMKPGIKTWVIKLLDCLQVNGDMSIDTVTSATSGSTTFPKAALMVTPTAKPSHYP